MATLPKDVFTEEVKSHDLLKQAYHMYLSNARTNNATTKDRSEVRGGGKKPWRQKGTGRARHGSIRSPIWRGGGVTFGPDGSENYTKTLPRKARLKAIRQALSVANKDGIINTITKFDVKDGKTKEIVKQLEKLKATRRVLMVTAQDDPIVFRAAANVANSKMVRPKQVTVYDVMNADTIIMENKAVDEIAEWLGTKA